MAKTVVIRVSSEPASMPFENRFTATVQDVERAGFADDPLDWYAVQCNPNNEFKAATGLLERGFLAYLPVEVRWHRPTRRGRSEANRVPKARPLMTGYLFVGLDRMQSIYRVRQTDGVRGMVGTEGKPSKIPETFIKKLMNREERGVFDQTRATLARYQPGDQVQVTTGAFAGQIGEVLAEIEDGKLRVEIAGLFGVGAPLDIADDHVEARRAA